MLYELTAAPAHKNQPKQRKNFLEMGPGHRQSRKSGAPQKSTIKLSLLKT